MKRYKRAAWMNCKVSLCMKDETIIETYCADDATASKWAAVWLSCAAMPHGRMPLDDLRNADGSPLGDYPCLFARDIIWCRCAVGEYPYRSSWWRTRPGARSSKLYPPEPVERLTYAEWVARQGR